MLLLIEYGANVDAADFSTLTPLDIAGISKTKYPVNQEAVEILQKHGATRSTSEHARASRELLTRDQLRERFGHLPTR